MKTENHIHWIILAYNAAPGGGVKDTVTIDILAKDRNEAHQKAQRLVPLKEHYTITNVIEHLPGACK